MIYLHKIFPLIISPLIFIIAIIILGIIFKSRKLSLFGMTLLIFCSLPIVSNKLIFYLEYKYEPKNISTLNNADGIIVLSGMLNTIKTSEGYKYEFTNAVDRFFSGIELMKNNKAPLLVLTRGTVPWSIGVPEGEYLKNIAIEFGIRENQILLTKNVQNTEQEAKAVKEIFPDEDINLILVTSAFHMPRAVKVFEANDLNVITFPVDFRRKNTKFTILDLIPSASSLAKTSHFIKEMIGRFYYKLKYR